MKGVAWLSIVGLLAFLCTCSVPSAVWHWRDSSRCDFIDLSAVPLQSFHLASNFSLLPRSLLPYTIHTIFDIHILKDACRIFICSRCSLQNSWQPFTAKAWWKHAAASFRMSSLDVKFQLHSWTQLTQLTSPCRRCCIPRCVVSSSVLWCPDHQDSAGIVGGSGCFRLEIGDIQGLKQWRLNWLNSHSMKASGDFIVSHFPREGKYDILRSRLTGRYLNTARQVPVLAWVQQYLHLKDWGKKRPYIFLDQKNWHYQHTPGLDHLETFRQNHYVLYTLVWFAMLALLLCFHSDTHGDLEILLLDVLDVDGPLLHGHQELWSHSMFLPKWSYKIPNLLALSLGLKRFTCLFKQLERSLRLGQ